MSTSPKTLALDAKSSRSSGRKFVTLCGRIFEADPSYFPRAEYRGRLIYLCTEACLGAFISDPDIFYKIHRNSEKGKTNVETR
jgi:YHS domain-containing protein